MNATASPEPPIILATPLDVEESRAQRLQRQQTRFRDRGGIFVPMNRTTLVDILLGRASPLKKPCRSASVSPSRVNKDETSPGNDVSKPSLRRSPRKQSQKILGIVTKEQPPTMNDDPGSERGKPIKKATSSKTSKLRSQKKAKVPLKRTTKLRGGAPVDDSVVDKLSEKAGKRTVDTSEKKTVKVLMKNIIPNADDHSGDVPLVKPKPTDSKTKAQEVDGAKGTSKTRRYKPTTATSAAVTSPTRLERTKKVEDNIACMPTKERATEKVKKSAPHLATAPKTSWAVSNLNEAASSQLPEISEDEEHNLKKHGPPSSQDVTKASLLKDHLVDSRSAKSLNTSDDDGDDDISPIKSKSTNSQEIDGAKPQLKPTKIMESVYSELSKDNSVDDVACKPTKKSTANKVKASAAPSMGTEPSSRRKGKGASNVDIFGDEEHDLGKGDNTPSNGTANAVQTSKGKKRAGASLAQDSDLQRRRKRNKWGTTETEISLSHSNLSDEAPLVTSKKRRRNSEDAESVEDSVDKRNKRKKHSGPHESGQTPEITVEEDVAKRSSKAKATKSTHKCKKQSSDNTTTASKRKENIRMSKSSKKVASNSGPPKSVLQRIKDSLGAEVVDNEPDPIDFLS